MGALWYNLVNRKMPKSDQNCQKVAKKAQQRHKYQISLKILQNGQLEAKVCSKLKQLLIKSKIEQYGYPLVQFGNKKMPKISQTLSPILSPQLSQINTTIKSKFKHYGKHKNSYLIIKNQIISKTFSEYNGFQRIPNKFDYFPLNRYINLDQNLYIMIMLV